MNGATSEEDSRPGTALVRYRKLTQLVEARRAELLSVDNTELLALLQQANELPDANHTPNERLMDARLFRNLTGCGDVKVRRLSLGNLPTSPLEFISSVKETYKIGATEQGDEEIAKSGAAMDWEQIGEDMLSFFGSVAPKWRCMQGFMSAAPVKEIRSRAPRKREEVSATIKEPTQRFARDSTGGNNAEKVVDEIWSIVQDEEFANGISITQLVLDHDSFPQTVVNLFNLMFLVKDKVVAMIDKGEEGIFVKLNHDRNIESKQMVIALTESIWRKWCKETPRAKCKMTQSDSQVVAEPTVFSPEKSGHSRRGDNVEGPKRKRRRN